MQQSTAPEKLSYKEDPKSNAWISLERGKKIRVNWGERKMGKREDEGLGWAGWTQDRGEE